MGRSASFSGGPRPADGEQGRSRAESLVSGSGSGSIFAKIKKLELPKFCGEARAYNSFKRDFLRLVAHADVGEDWIVAHSLRHQCLQGRPQAMCANLPDSPSIWRRLDEEYGDPMRAVEDVNATLMRAPRIGEEEFDRFVGFVDFLENASVDLRAAHQHAALDNPFTCHHVIARCPSWVRGPLVAETTGAGVSAHNFEDLLQVLIKRRSEARRLASLNVGRGRQAAPAGRDRGAPVRVGVGAFGAVWAGGDDIVEQADTGWEQVAAGSDGASWREPGGDRGSGSGTTAAAAGTTAAGRPGAGPGRPPLRCLLSDCDDDRPHYLARCQRWAALDLTARMALVRGNRLCRLCLEPGHMAGTCPKRGQWRPCPEEGCGQWHHRSLHGGSWRAAERALGLGGGGGVLLAQDVDAASGGACRVLWDSGSSVSLVANGFARRARLRGIPASIWLTVVGGERQLLHTKLYRVPLIDHSGLEHIVLAYGIEEVAGHVQGLELTGRWQRIRRAAVRSGPVELLVGIPSASLHPRFDGCRGEWAIYHTSFGGGFLAAGGGGGERGVAAVVSAFSGAAAACAAAAFGRGAERPATDFITVEGMGTDAPKRCPNCIGCRQCKFRLSQMTWQEAEELSMIEKGLSFDEDRKKWTSTYPCRVDPALLSNNRDQAMRLMEGLERQLERSGRLNEFNEGFEDAIRRGVFIPVAEPDTYAGPVNYISLVVAYKEGPHATTPLRICLNSSLKYRGRSLNSVLVKGPPALNELFGVALRFRRWPVAFVRDIKKFYQSVAASERDQHLRRILWRGGDASRRPTTYRSATVNFGDRPAGAVAQTALRNTAIKYSDVHPEAADTIEHASYVDDTVGGGEDRTHAQSVSDGVQAVASGGGFQYGDAVMSGDEVEGDVRKVLGIPWCPSGDTIGVDARVNYHAKVRGARGGPDHDIGGGGDGGGSGGDNGSGGDGGSGVGDAGAAAPRGVGEAVWSGLPARLTRRLIWRVSLGQFDLLGLLAPFLLRFKLLMRDLSAGGSAGGGARALRWDEEVPDAVRETFAKLLTALARAGRVWFPRCIRPTGMASTDVWLATFVDGATQASCAVCYALWPTATGHDARIICAKTRVTPLQRITIPRVELQGAVIGIRLATKVQEHLGPFAGRWFFTDSSAVLGILRGNMTLYKEFVGNRAAEIRSKSDVEAEWRWIPSGANVADIGTRGGVEPEQLEFGSEFQCGPSWIRGPVCGWPTRETFGSVPPEELHAVVAAAGGTAPDPEPEKIARLRPDRFSTIRRLLTVTSLVLLAADCFHGRPGANMGELTGWRRCLAAARAYRQDALDWLALAARPAVAADGGVRSLRPSSRTGARFPAVYVRGHRGEVASPGARPSGVPLVHGASPLGALIIRSAHEELHAGVARTVLQTRRTAWVTASYRAAKRALARCARCRRDRARADSQIMAPLPPERISAARSFEHIAVDLFGPLPLVDGVRRRVRGEAFGLIIVCLATTAAHVEVCGGMTADKVALALRRFFALRGAPSTIISDPGTQLVAVSKEVELWTGPVGDMLATAGIQWTLIPAGSQHRNGLAERLVGIIKKAISVFCHGGVPALPKEEWDTLAAEVTAKVNARPLAVRGEAGEAFCPISPGDLLNIRAEPAPVQEYSRASLYPRLQAIQELSRLFWNRWITFVLPIVQRQSKWPEEADRPAAVGDVVLLLYESRIERRYKLGRVVEVHPSASDGLIRTVTVDYAREDGSRHALRRSVHTIATILPLVDQ